MMNLLVLTILVLCVLTLGNSLREGDSCITQNVLGVCRNLTDCLYAYRLIKIDKQRPTRCAWQRNDVEVVCCPLEKNLHRIGIYRPIFGDTHDGIIRSPNLRCSYDGGLPLLCCDEKKTLREKPEPRGCPALTKPTNKIEHIAWQKCVQYQRYSNVCVLNEYNNTYEQRKSCVVSDLELKISGGVKALNKEFPHMALLGCRHEVNFDFNIKWVAGGTLISERFILTAAHVVSHLEYGVVRYALLGALAKSSARDGEIHHIIKREIHNGYRKVLRYRINGVGQVIFTEFIRPACLALPEMNLSDDRILAGWGETGSAGPASDSLLKTRVSEYNESTCSALIDSQILTRGWDAKSMICAGAGLQTNDSCHDDSGGPLMAYPVRTPSVGLRCHDLFCTYAVRGIVSWGSQCGQGTPGVYTNVIYYLDWIAERVWKTAAPLITEA